MKLRLMEMDDRHGNGWSARKSVPSEQWDKDSHNLPLDSLDLKITEVISAQDQLPRTRPKTEVPCGRGRPDTWGGSPRNLGHLGLAGLALLPKGWWILMGGLCLACVTSFPKISTLLLISNFRMLRNAHNKGSLCISRILQSNLEAKKINKMRNKAVITKRKWLCSYGKFY